MPPQLWAGRGGLEEGVGVKRISENVKTGNRGVQIGMMRLVGYDGWRLMVNRGWWMVVASHHEDKLTAGS